MRGGKIDRWLDRAWRRAVSVSIHTGESEQPQRLLLEIVDPAQVGRIRRVLGTGRYLDDIVGRSGRTRCGWSARTARSSAGRVCTGPTWSLLVWLGSVTWPVDALTGDGKLALRLLDRCPRSDILAALDNASEPALLMGAVGWVSLTRDERGVAERIGPGLVEFLG